MPTKNTIKTYSENGYYHLYNRGVDKREIFLDPKDCVMFLYYLKLYLSPPEVLEKSEQFLTPRMQYKLHNLNLTQEIDLLSFALMPNHFHLQVKQYTKDGIAKLMRRVITSYVQYFNKRYKRAGVLFESAYKGVLTETEYQHLYLSSYIHRNPMKLTASLFDFVQFSSYPYYLKSKQAHWVKPDEILSYFRSAKNITSSDTLSYQNFVERSHENPEGMLGDLVIEKDS